jgi:hypothetical protein
VSNVRRREIWPVVRTILEETSGIKSKELLAQVREKTGVSTSTIYEQLHSLEEQGKYYRENGQYWLTRPEQREKSQLGFWEWLKQRSEAKVPTIAGLLEVLSASVPLLLSSYALLVIVGNPEYQGQVLFLLYGLAASLLGFIGGAFTLKRRRFMVAIAGVFSVMLWGIWFDYRVWRLVTTSGSAPSSSGFQAVLVGAIPTVCSILSLALLHASRKEFS